MTYNLLIAYISGGLVMWLGVLVPFRKEWRIVDQVIAIILWPIAIPLLIWKSR